MRPLDGQPPFRQVRELVRRVQADCTIELDTNAYSVPWRLIGETVEVVVAGGRVRPRPEPPTKKPVQLVQGSTSTVLPHRTRGDRAAPALREKKELTGLQVGAIKEGIKTITVPFGCAIVRRECVRAVENPPLAQSPR